ncbi:hypothetical protein ACHAPM_010670 [Fusarium culmorum]
MIHQLLFTSWLTFAFASPAPAPAPVSKPSLIDSILNNPSIPEVTLAELGLSETGHDVKNFGLAKRLINLKLTMYDIALNSGHLGRLIISYPVPTAPGTTIGTHPLDILFVANSQNPDEQFCFYTSTYMVRLASLANASGGACNSPSKLADTTSTFNVTSNRIKDYLASYSILPEDWHPRFQFGRTCYYSDMLGSGINLQFDNSGKISSGLVAMLGHRGPPYDSHQFMTGTFGRTFNSTGPQKMTYPIL